MAETRIRGYPRYTMVTFGDGFTAEAVSESRVTDNYGLPIKRLYLSPSDRTIISFPSLRSEMDLNGCVWRNFRPDWFISLNESSTSRAELCIASMDGEINENFSQLKKLMAKIDLLRIEARNNRNMAAAYQERYRLAMNNIEQYVSRVNEMLSKVGMQTPQLPFIGDQIIQDEVKHE